MELGMLEIREDGSLRQANHREIKNQTLNNSSKEMSNERESTSTDIRRAETFYVNAVKSKSTARDEAASRNGRKMIGGIASSAEMQNRRARMKLDHGARALNGKDRQHTAAAIQTTPRRSNHLGAKQPHRGKAVTSEPRSSNIRVKQSHRRQQSHRSEAVTSRRSNQRSNPNVMNGINNASTQDTVDIDAFCISGENSNASSQDRAQRNRRKPAVLRDYIHWFGDRESCNEHYTPDDCDL